MARFDSSCETIMKRVHLLTGNPDKIKAANLVFNKHEIEVLPLTLDIPEIQAANSVEIAHYTVENAYKMTGKPTIREDHSFFIKELGFPGPFMAYADKTVDNDHLLKILATLNSREAYFELGVAYVDVNGKIYDFSYRVPVVMSEEARGNEKLRWERMMMFPGDTKTFAELNADDHLEIWTENYESIAELIRNER